MRATSGNNYALFLKLIRQVQLRNNRINTPPSGVRLQVSVVVASGALDSASKSCHEYCRVIPQLRAKPVGKQPGDLWLKRRQHNTASLLWVYTNPGMPA